MKLIILLPILLVVIIPVYADTHKYEVMCFGGNTFYAPEGDVLELIKEGGVIGYCIDDNKVVNDPQIDIDVFHTPYAWIQKPFDFHIFVSENYNPLHNANITTTIQAHDNNYIIDTFTGSTNPHGYYTDSDFITTHDYLSHGLYNLTISVQYDSFEQTKRYQFWTQERNY